MDFLFLCDFFPFEERKIPLSSYFQSVEMQVDDIEGMGIGQLVKEMGTKKDKTEKNNEEKKEEKENDEIKKRKDRNTLTH